MYADESHRSIIIAHLNTLGNNYFIEQNFSDTAFVFISFFISNLITGWSSHGCIRSLPQVWPKRVDSFPRPASLASELFLQPRSHDRLFPLRELDAWAARVGLRVDQVKHAVIVRFFFLDWRMVLLWPFFSSSSFSGLHSLRGFWWNARYEGAHGWQEGKKKAELRDSSARCMQKRHLKRWVLLTHTF